MPGFGHGACGASTLITISPLECRLCAGEHSIGSNPQIHSHV